MKAPPSEKVWVGIPSYDRRLDIGCVAGLFQCAHLYSRPFFLVGMSNISLARNEIAHIFMEKLPQYEWFVMIDSDIVFTIRDWQLLWDGSEDVVCAEYAKKIVGQSPTQFGLGFCRVHRSVFEKIKALKREDGDNVGEEYAQRFYHKGEMMVNYFPNGANPQGRWLGEDHGFFMLAQLTDIKPRLETRTTLAHVGYFEFSYPNQIKGYKMITETELNYMDKPPQPRVPSAENGPDGGTFTSDPPQTD